MKEKKFIITKSNLVADMLKHSGYTLVSQQGEMWTFMNNGKHTFSQDDKKEMVFSNKLFL